MNLIKNKMLLAAFFLTAIAPSCNTKLGKGVVGALLPATTEDVKLGEQVATEIASKPNEYPVLPERGNEQVYNYIRGITAKILNSGNVENKDAFKWEVKIIKDDKTLNAFCTPGGYIYVYTGLIKYLDTEDQLAGVMGHEIAHADKRHSMRQLVQMYGLQMLLQLTASAASSGRSEGTQQAAMTVAQVTGAVVGLRFSRDHETEADNMSVHYLCGTDYNAAGAAGFFEKIGNEGSPPEWLSTHPNPTNRVGNIHAQADKKGCKGTNRNQTEYQRIKSLLK